MNIYERLQEDHEKQRTLARQVEDLSGDSESRRKLFKELCDEVEAHAAAEEQTFYAALIEKPDGQDKARHSIAEHKDAADLLEALDELDFGGKDWSEKFSGLKHCLIHHVDEEEEEVFPLAQKLIDSQVAEKLAATFEKRKASEVKHLLRASETEHS